MKSWASKAAWNVRAGLTALLFLLGLGLAACSKAPEEQAAADPVAFEAGDECHVCGMIVTEFPGPKGQAIESRSGNVRKFCSTRDILSWWLQPENRNLQASLFVHDMANTEWQHPDDRHLIDARTAFYVIGSRLKGSMGQTLASFGSEAAAEQVAQEQGGLVLRFEDITMETLAQLLEMPHESTDAVH